MTNDNEMINEASSFEIAAYYLVHIMQPCSVRVKGKTENIRGFYIREAREILPRLHPNSSSLLENVLNEYSTKESY